MNERIQELIPQAYELVRKNHGGYFTQELLLSCMAELIVRECMKVSRGADGLDATHEAWYLIKEHFGVGE